MDFNKKNDFIVKHRGKAHFEKDAELYLATFSDRRLVGALKKAQDYNKDRLDGRILLELLEVKTPEEILNNRKEQTDTVTLTPEEAEELIDVDDLSSLDFEQYVLPAMSALEIEADTNDQLACFAAIAEYKEKKEESKDDKLTIEEAEELIDVEDLDKLDYFKQIISIVDTLNLKPATKQKVDCIAAITEYKHKKKEGNK